MVSVPKPIRKKKIKKKLKSLKSLTAKADKVFSLFIRNRDAVETKGRCVTCGDVGTQCGHYVSRRYKALRWDVRNAGLQCSRCNCWGAGESDSMALWLVNKYGWEVLNELNYLKIAPFKLTREHLERVITSYS